MKMALEEREIPAPPCCPTGAIRGLSVPEERNIGWRLREKHPVAAHGIRAPAAVARERRNASGERIAGVPRARKECDDVRVKSHVAYFRG